MNRSYKGEYEIAGLFTWVIGSTKSCQLSRPRRVSTTTSPQLEIFMISKWNCCRSRVPWHDSLSSSVETRLRYGSCAHCAVYYEVGKKKQFRRVCVWRDSIRRMSTPRHYGSIIARYFPRIETFIASRMEVRSLIDYWKYIVFLDIYIFFFSSRYLLNIYYCIAQ